MSQPAAPTGRTSDQFNPFDVPDEPAPTQRPTPAPTPAPAPPAATPTPKVPAKAAPKVTPAAPTRVPTGVKKPATATAPVTPAIEPAPSATAAPAADADTETAAKDRSTPDQETLATRRRRLKRIAAVVAIAGLYLWVTKPWVDLAATSQAAGTSTEATRTSADATDQAAADMAYAEQYLAANGTLNGIVIDGVQLAVRDQTMYAVRTIDGTCTVYGLLNGQRITPTPDPTAAACSGQIVTVQAQLDEAANTAENTSTWAAEDSLKKAADAAVAYASRNYVNGVPSMMDLPTSIAGALVMENTGEYVTLRVSYPGACLETFVTAAGEIGDTNTCS